MTSYQHKNRQSKLQPRSPRKIRKPTLQRLENIALYYLTRYEANTQKLRNVLMRRIEKAVYEKLIDKDTGCEMVEKIVKKAVDEKWIDDQRFADLYARKFFGQGYPYHVVKLKMHQKNIESSLINQALEEFLKNEDLDHEEQQWQQIKRFAKRKHIGPYCLQDRLQRRKKHLGILARNGFSFELASKIIDADLDDL
ncbi:MAG: RecX family transcriptional regulator [Pseudomonadota bacterium]